MRAHGLIEDFFLRLPRRRGGCFRLLVLGIQEFRLQLDQTAAIWLRT